MNEATLNQISYIKKLLEKKLFPGNPDALAQTLTTLTKSEASMLIGKLLACPWKSTAPAVPVPAPKNPAPVTPINNVPKTPKIGEGHYAVVDNDGVLKFYSVQVPEDGQWKGYTFLAYEAGDRYMPIKDRAERNRIFELIAKNPEEAMKEYGRKIGKCGHCHRKLTDQESRDRGIGPICAGIVTRRFQNWGKEHHDVR